MRVSVEASTPDLKQAVTDIVKDARSLARADGGEAPKPPVRATKGRGATATDLVQKSEKLLAALEVESRLDSNTGRSDGRVQLEDLARRAEGLANALTFVESHRLSKAAQGLADDARSIVREDRKAARGDEWRGRKGLVLPGALVAV